MLGGGLFQVQINETVFIWPGWIALGLMVMCHAFGVRSKLALVFWLLLPLGACAWAWWIVVTNLDHGHVLIRRAIYSILYGVRDGHPLSVKFWASNLAMAVALGMAIGMSRRSPVVQPAEAAQEGNKETGGSG